MGALTMVSSYTTCQLQYNFTDLPLKMSMEFKGYTSFHNFFFYNNNIRMPAFVSVLFLSVCACYWHICVSDLKPSLPLSPACRFNVCWWLIASWDTLARQFVPSLQTHTHAHISNPNKSLEIWKRNRHSGAAAKQDALENRTPHPT